MNRLSNIDLLHLSSYKNMKFRNVAIIISLISLADLAHSLSISASYSMIYGSPLKYSTRPAIFPSEFGERQANNTPGGRSRHKIFVYSNIIYSLLGNPLARNDVWAFNIADKTWNWIAGNSTSGAPFYGTRGVAAVSNTPGYRYSFGGDFHRARGEYILFGGFAGTGGVRADLWSFNLTSNFWKWVAGQSSNEISVYNTIGVSTNSTTPGGRTGSNCVVYPPTGEFLLFGGYTGLQRTADMWAFNFNNLRWTWISGSSKRNVSASVGSKGEWSTEFYPASRSYHSDLTLQSESNIVYLFGGVTSGGSSNDLWAFKRDTLEWAWLSGSTTVYSIGNCGIMGYPGPNNFPGARTGHTMVYHISTGLLIMFGGNGVSCTGAIGELSDTWSFNISSNEWTWISGSSIADDIPANYITLGPQSYSAVAANPETSDIYMFGGVGYLSQSWMWNNDYLWLANASDGPLHLSDSKTLVAEKATLSSHITQSTLSDAVPNLTDKTLTKSRTGKYLLAEISLAILLVGYIIVAYKFVQRRSKRNESTIVVEPSTTNMSLQTGSNTTSSSWPTTLGVSTIGIYLPGGLHVDGNSAYKVEKLLRRGGGGSVWLATAIDPLLQEFGDTVVVKIPKAKDWNERAVALFHQEISLMNAFRRNRNIAKLLGYSTNPCAIILRNYPDGSLSDWISLGTQMLRQSHAFIQDISLGLIDLHSNGVAHCDLKPENVLIECGWRLFAVITDFGISRIVTNELLKVNAYEVQTVKGGSLAYAAPEAVLELRGGKAAHISPSEIMSRDIYAIGMIIAVLFNGTNIWK